MKQFASVLLLLVAVGLAQADIHAGPCPEYYNIRHFDLATFLGRWYEIERYPTNFEEDMVCVTAIYTAGHNDTTFKVNDTADIHSTFISQQGEGSLTNVVGELKITLTDTPTSYVNVLATDYYKYASLYACENLQEGEFRNEYAWVLSRSHHLDAPLLVEARDAFAKFGIDVGKFSSTAQGSWCTY